jgi:hypothetical protein
MFLVACFRAANRSVWIDEAMYLSNLHQHWQDYFKPLPFYDQASPPLVSVFLSFILDISSNNIYILRLTILLTVFISLAYFGWQMTKTYKIPQAAITVMFLACNGVFIRYATETKQYALEIAASLILLGCYAQSMRRHTDGQKGAYLFLILSIVLSFFSFGVPLGASALMFERTVFVKNKTIAKHWRLSFFAFLCLYSLLYLVCFKKILFIQFNNYLQVYNVNILRDNFNSLFFWKHTVSIISQLFLPRLLLVPCVFIAMILAAFNYKSLSADQFAPVRIALILLSEVLLLSGFGMYPLATTRQFLYTLPFIAFMIGWSVQQLINYRQKWSSMGSYLVIILMLLSGIKNDYYAYADKFDFQKTKNLYEFIVNSGYKRILVECFVQPSLEFYAMDSKLSDRILIGKLMSTTVALPTYYDISNNYPGAFETIGGWQALIPIGQWDRLSHSRYDLYTDWLISKAPGNEAVLLVTTAPRKNLPQTWEPLMQSISKRGCRSRILFEDNGVLALSLVCPD